MKSRKKMKHVQLVQEVIQQVKARFPPKIPDIKKNIEALMEKDYIERLDGDELAYIAWTIYASFNFFTIMIVMPKHLGDVSKLDFLRWLDWDEVTGEVTLMDFPIALCIEDAWPGGINESVVFFNFLSSC